MSSPWQQGIAEHSQKTPNKQAGTLSLFHFSQLFVLSNNLDSII